MNLDAEIFQRCADMVSVIDDTEGWGLDVTATQTLAEIVLTYIHPEIGDAQICTVILNLHRDRPTVAALCMHGSAAHHQEWEIWMGQVRAILHKAHLDWAHDGAVDLDDLAQIALLELARALPSFRYQSRFSTWAYKVITRGVQRHLRDMSAQKRAGEIDVATDPQTLERTIGADELPEAQAEAHYLTTAISAELMTALGSRNAEIFRLWACDDLSAEMIGQRMGLSVARVYAVISHARIYLRGHATIRDWRELPED